MRRISRMKTQWPLPFKLSQETCHLLLALGLEKAMKSLKVSKRLKATAERSD